MLDNAPLHFPEARDWMWNYCIYLVPYSEKGINYDLGIFINSSNKASYAIVYGDHPGDYMSGNADVVIPSREIHAETIKRAKALNLLR